MLVTSAFFFAAILSNWRTQAAAENLTMSFLSDMACEASGRSVGSLHLAMASRAAARTTHSRSESALESARLLRGSGSCANSLAAAARVGELLRFFHARTASIPYPP